jgi:hypothetical protein
VKREARAHPTKNRSPLYTISIYYAPSLYTLLLLKIFTFFNSFLSLYIYISIRIREGKYKRKESKKGKKKGKRKEKRKGKRII